MNAEMDIGTNKKAFQINLDPKKYGTFAEIGAGQEVARRFFLVGGAAGTVAKTMSAYDMTFSDAIYGTTDRYVSRGRLHTMLDHEYDLLVERLDEKCGGERTFFVFADTVAARSFKQHNESHGWLGVRFQTETRGEPSEIIIHVRMLDEANVDQQEALGVVGREPALRRVLLSPAGEVDRVAPGKSGRGPHPGGHDQVFRAGLREGGQSAHESAAREPGSDERGHVHGRRRDGATGGSLLQESDPGRARKFPARDLRDERHVERRARRFSEGMRVRARKISWS